MIIRFLPKENLNDFNARSAEIGNEYNNIRVILNRVKPSFIRVRFDYFQDRGNIQDFMNEFEDLFE